MSGDRGSCAACQEDLTPDNSSRLRGGRVVHIGCPGAVSESRLSLKPAEPTSAAVPASLPAEGAPRKGRRMSIGGASSDVPVGGAGGVRDPFAAVAEGARVAACAWREASSKIAESFRSSRASEMFAKLTEINGHGPNRSVGGSPIFPGEVADRNGRAEAQAECDRVNALNGEAEPAEPDDFELPEHCSVCGRGRSKRLGLVLSSGTHRRCKPSQVSAAARETEAELKTEKAGLEEELADAQAELEACEEKIEAVAEHPDLGESARRVMDSITAPASRSSRSAAQASLLEEPPKRGYGVGPGGAIRVVDPAREPGEQIHLFPEQHGFNPFGEKRPKAIRALCDRVTEAATRELEPTVAVLGAAGNVPERRVCAACERYWTPESRVFPAYVKPSQWKMETAPDKVPSASATPAVPVGKLGARRKR